MSLVRRKLRTKGRVPDGFDRIEDVLNDFEHQLRDAVNEEHEGKRRAETTWKVHRLHWEKNRFLHDLMYVKKAMSRELFDFLVTNKVADGALIAKWRKPGYELLCSTLAVQKSGTAFGTTALCRVPLRSRAPQQRLQPSVMTGCVSCASGDGRFGGPIWWNTPMEDEEGGAGGAGGGAGAAGAAGAGGGGAAGASAAAAEHRATWAPVVPPPEELEAQQERRQEEEVEEDEGDEAQRRQRRQEAAAEEGAEGAEEAAAETRKRARGEAEDGEDEEEKPGADATAAAAAAALRGEGPPRQKSRGGKGDGEGGGSSGGDEDGGGEDEEGDDLPPEVRARLAALRGEA